MLVIRLFRTGKTNQPLFKIVVTDKKNPPKGGRFIEVVGSYSPVTKKRDLKAERIKYWMSVGAKPSPTVFNFLVFAVMARVEEGFIFLVRFANLISIRIEISLSL